MAPQNERTLKDFPASDQLPAWRTFTEYFQLLEKAGIAVNVVHNVGATQVRRIVVGDANRQPSANQLDQMKALVDESMRQGAVGLSSALIYPPGVYARTSELVELAKTAASHHGVYFTHIRNEGRELLPSVEEAIQIGREAHIPVHIYHLKAAGQENWALFGGALRLIEKARDNGVDVTADVYPYVRNGIPLTSFLPAKYFDDGSDAILDRLTDHQTRGRIRNEMETTSDWENWYLHAGKDWSNVLIAEVPAGLDRTYEGKSVTAVSKLRNEDPWETFFFLLHSGRAEINVDPLTMDEQQKDAALNESFVCIASDSAPTNLKKATTAHPRTFGTFPRIFAKYVREDGAISLENAVRAMSSLPANILQLTDRGRIAASMAADIVIFDPSLVQDVSTFEQPLAYPKGIAYVLVNGRVAVDAGQVTGLRSGRVLRHTP